MTHLSRSPVTPMPLLMGVINVTPDSFSDGGRHDTTEKAAQRAVTLAREGAHFIDVGGESTRPGAERVDIETQKQRVIPAITAIRQALDREAFDAVRISVDTTHSQVAAAALDAGAHMINDIAAGTEDPAMFTLAAKQQAPLILMHMQGQPGTMQMAPTYRDVVRDVIAYLRERTEKAQAAGCLPQNLLIDPGIGFGKTVEHNLALLGGLADLVATGYPVVLGTSRKSFMAKVSPETAQAPADRLPGTCVTSAAAVYAGVHVLRVHDIQANRQAVEIAAAIHQTNQKPKIL